MSNPKLSKLIKSKSKIHVYGESGSGKTHTVNNTLKSLGVKNVLISAPRLEEDLLSDFGDLMFQDDVDAVFVIEGDNYYWKKYGLVKRFLTDCKNCVIIITIKKEKPTKNITKYCTQVKIQSPTRSDVLKYVKSVDPNFDGNILDIYDKDWRVVLRRLQFGELHDDKLEKPQWIDSKVLAYKLIKGKAKLEDFENCTDPINFVINWISYNATEFWDGKSLVKNLDILSWCDAHKYINKPIYIQNALMRLVPSFRKGFMKFPAWKKKPKEAEATNESIVVRKIKRSATKKKPTPKKNTEYKGLEEEEGLGGFLML